MPPKRGKRKRDDDEEEEDRGPRVPFVDRSRPKKQADDDEIKILEPAEYERDKKAKERAKRARARAWNRVPNA